MLRGFFGNLIFAIIARMLCANHLERLFVPSRQKRKKRNSNGDSVFQNGRKKRSKNDTASKWQTCRHLNFSAVFVFQVSQPYNFQKLMHAPLAVPFLNYMFTTAISLPFKLSTAHTFSFRSPRNCSLQRLIVRKNTLLASHWMCSRLSPAGP